MAGDALFSEFLRRIRAGDDRAARELMARYEPLVRREVRFRLRDPRLQRVFDSSDICQSVFASFFVRAAAGQYDLHDSAQLLNLLMEMARRKLAFRVRQQRAQRRDNRRLQEGEILPDQAMDRGPSPSEQLHRRELLAELRKRLSAEERQVADLRGHGCGWSEIATRLGGTAEARRMQLTRALDRVARELGLDEENSE